MLLTTFFPAFSIITLNLLNLILIKYLNTKGVLNHFSSRKILHVTSSFGAVLATFLLTQYGYIFVSFLFAVIYILFYFRKNLHFITHESFQSFGAPLFPISLMLMAVFLWKVQLVHIVGILVLGIPDTVGANEELSAIEQSTHQAKRIKLLVYFIFCAAFLLVILPIHLALFSALAITMVEHYSTKGSDNLTVPLTYVLIILILNVV